METLDNFLSRCFYIDKEFSVLVGTENNQNYLFSPILARRGNDYLLETEGGAVLYLQDTPADRVYEFFKKGGGFSQAFMAGKITTKGRPLV